jgi:hypothetical protein
VFLALWFPRNSLLKITDENIKLNVKQWEENKSNKCTDKTTNKSKRFREFSQALALKYLESSFCMPQHYTGIPP